MSNSNMDNKGFPWSLGMKLNLRIILNTVAVLILINLFLFFATFVFTVWQAEEDAAFLMSNKEKIDTILSNDWQKNDFTYSVENALNEKEGIELWPVLQERTPLKNYQVLRSIVVENEQLSFLGALKTMTYRMGFLDEKFVFDYELGRNIFEYAFLFQMLLVFEVLILLRGAYKGNKKIKKILRPISEMTQLARKAEIMTASAGKKVNFDEMKRLRELAGTISSIDATKLDQRLPIDGTQKELKELAKAINSMLDRIDEAYTSQVRFVSDASHELRTPIAVIQGYANLLDRWGKNDPDTLEEAIEAIKGESENMKDLIEQLLFLARGDNETLHLYLETFDCAELVEEVLHETQMIDDAHTFKMKDGDRGFITADRQLMKQALRILVDNSIKYTPQDGEIIVSVKADSSSLQFVRISVQDNGIGMDPDNLPHIFDRFYRSDESRARKTGGSGLGLAIMKWIIDRHGGRIEVVSRKGIGTRTTIVMPKVDPPIKVELSTKEDVTVSLE